MRKQLLRSVMGTIFIAATPVAAAQVTVSDAWFRALPSSLPAGGYFTLHNNGAALQLTGAESAACGMLMLHKSTETGGMATMSMVASIDIPAGGTLVFELGSYHLMCTNPTSAIKPGASVTVTLMFGNGMHVTATFAVKNAAGK